MTIPQAKTPAQGERPATRESPAGAKGQRREEPGQPHRPRKRFIPPRRRRGDEDAPAAGGPLAHQRPSQRPPGPTAPVPSETPPVEAVADRILTGFTARGEATARVDLKLSSGEFSGATVDFVAGARGLEVNVMAATAAARRVIQAKLNDLADALAERGVYARKLAVSVREGDNRGGSRQDGRR